MPSGVSWTNRSRLQAALACNIADRVPINTYELTGYNMSDWYNNQPSYASLMEYIRKQADCVVDWIPQIVNAQGTPCVPFLASTHPVTLISKTEQSGEFSRLIRTFRCSDGEFQSILQTDPKVNTKWRVEHLCKSTEDVTKALKVPYEPICYDASQLQPLKDIVGDKGLIMASVRDPAYETADLMAFQSFLMWAFSETDHFARTVEVMAERTMENLKRFLESGVVDLYRIVGPEYFTPPYLPPKMFRRFVVPHLTRMIELIHAHGGKARVHCHGKINQVLDMILDTGCDGIDPCEPPPDGDMELDVVKRKCLNKKVSVWGNIELKLLENESSDTVRTAVIKALEQAKEGGGYVIMPTASPIDTPLSSRTEANYRTFIETALEYGSY